MIHMGVKLRQEDTAVIYMLTSEKGCQQMNQHKGIKRCFVMTPAF